MAFPSTADIIQACADQVIDIEPDPLTDAASDFNLFTAEAIMDFIVNLGEAGLIEKNCLPLERPRWKAPPPPPEISVYAYNFWASRKNTRKSYLAFFRNPITDLWTLKSFKMDPEQPGHFPFRTPKLVEFRKTISLQPKPEEGNSK